LTILLGGCCLLKLGVDVLPIAKYPIEDIYRP
jgi:hypothetical protein